MKTVHDTERHDFATWKSIMYSASFHFFQVEVNARTMSVFVGVGVAIISLLFGFALHFLKLCKSVKLAAKNQDIGIFTKFPPLIARVAAPKG